LTELGLEQYDELVIAIRVSRLFTGESSPRDQRRHFSIMDRSWL
jgi:hypothetical protein